MIKNFNLFKESLNSRILHNNITAVKIFLDSEDIRNYKINDDLSVDVNDVVYIYSSDIKYLPVNFRNVSGDFVIDRSGLKSLIGCPRNVGGEFNVSRNSLTSLEYSPDYVGSHFHCRSNRIDNLDFITPNIGGGINISDNMIKSLRGCSKKILGPFDCNDNLLTSLEFGPKWVGGDYNISYNKLESLLGIADYIGGENIICINNELKSFKGFPESFKGNFNPNHNPIYNIFKLFDFRTELIELFNFYEPIGDKSEDEKINKTDKRPNLYMNRFNDFLSYIGKDPIERGKDIFGYNTIYL
jgi:hypothetical protein